MNKYGHGIWAITICKFGHKIEIRDIWLSPVADPRGVDKSGYGPIQFGYGLWPPSINVRYCIIVGCSYFASAEPLFKGCV